jgi:hypothetical protein
MPSSEFALWAAYYQMHGFPAERIELTTANGLAHVCRANGMNVKASDLMPTYDYTPSSKLIAAKLNAWAASHNRSISGKRKSR